jgi:hypothetical protein
MAWSAVRELIVLMSLHLWCGSAVARVGAALRGLLLLQDEGVIKLKSAVGLKLKIGDVVDNPKKLKFVEIAAAQTP